VDIIDLEGSDWTNGVLTEEVVVVVAWPEHLHAVVVGQGQFGG
jgi:hypothetical protein